MKYPEMKWGRMEAVVNMLGGETGIDDFLAHQFVLADPKKHKKGEKAPEPLFTFAGRFTTEGTKEFVAAKKFVRDTSENARVKISFIGSNFEKHLLPKIECDVAGGILNIQKVRRASIDLPKNPDEPGTIAGLGGLEKADTGLYGFHEALAYKQSVGDSSPLVGFAYDDNNVLWAVSADWDDGGWHVGANSPSNPGEWDAGNEFVSR